MALVKKIAKHGNSAGVILDQPILRHMGWEVGTEVKIDMKDGRMILTRHEDATDEDVEASTKRMAARHRKSLERLSR